MIKLKTLKEINGIRTSCHLLTSIFDEIVDHVSPGKTTMEINNYAEDLIKKYNAIPSFLKYGGFPSAMCISINHEVIHGVPSHTKIIKKGDIVSLDLGIVKNGFFSDMAKTISISTISKEKENLLKDTEYSLKLCIEEINKNQASLKSFYIEDIGRIISSYLLPLNYGIVSDFCGHGVGLKLHEDPQISHNYPSKVSKGIKICKGMTLAIEPMINLGSQEVAIDCKDQWTVKTVDKSPSAHFEHTIVILEDHVEILTQKKP